MAKLESMWASSSDEEEEVKVVEVVKKPIKHNKQSNHKNERRRSSNGKAPSSKAFQKNINKSSNDNQGNQNKPNPLATALGLSLSDYKTAKSDDDEEQWSDTEETFIAERKPNPRKAKNNNPLAQRLGISLDSHSTEKSKDSNTSAPVSHKTPKPSSKTELLKMKIEEQKKLLNKNKENKKVMDSIINLTDNLEWNAEDIDLSQIKI